MTHDQKRRLSALLAEQVMGWTRSMSGWGIGEPFNRTMFATFPGADSELRIWSPPDSLEQCRELDERICEKHGGWVEICREFQSWVVDYCIDGHWTKECSAESLSEAWSLAIARARGIEDHEWDGSQEATS